MPVRCPSPKFQWSNCVLNTATWKGSDTLYYRKRNVIFSELFNCTVSVEPTCKGMSKNHLHLNQRFREAANTISTHLHFSKPNHQYLRPPMWDRDADCVIGTTMQRLVYRHPTHSKIKGSWGHYHHIDTPALLQTKPVISLATNVGQSCLCCHRNEKACL